MTLITSLIIHRNLPLMDRYSKATGFKVPLCSVFKQHGRAIITVTNEYSIPRIINRNINLSNINNVFIHMHNRIEDIENYKFIKKIPNI